MDTKSENPKREEKSVTSQTIQTVTPPACDVCCEDYNRSTLKPVVCAKCKFSACRRCYERYFLDNVGEPHCMSCRDIWGYMRLYNLFTKTWVNTKWSTHRSNVLMGYEKSKLPNAMSYVENERKFRQTQTKLSDANKKYQTAYGIAYVTPSKQTKQECARLHKEYQEANRENINAHLISPYVIMRRYGQRRPIQRTIEDPFLENIAEAKRPKKTFKWHCSNGDCRGYLDENFQCGACGMKACEKCHTNIEDAKFVETKTDDEKVETKDDDDDDEKVETKTNFIKKRKTQHKCNPDDVETVNNIKRTTKQCPNCNIHIHKINGCSQIWCTQCFTAFDYNTGEVAQGRIHNPHYYQYMREHKGGMPREEDRVAAQEQRNNPCGTPYWTDVDNCERQYHIQYHLQEFRRLLMHVEDVTMRRLTNQRDMVERRQCSMFLRIRYLMNELNDNEWGKILNQQDKSKIWAHEGLQIYFTWIQGIRDRIRHVVYDKKLKRDDIISTINEMLELTKMTNQHLHKLSLCYGINIWVIKLNTTEQQTVVHRNIDTQYTRIINDYIDPVNRTKFKRVPRPTKDEVLCHILRPNAA